MDCMVMAFQKEHGGFQLPVDAAKVYRRVIAAIPGEFVVEMVGLLLEQHFSALATLFPSVALILRTRHDSEIELEMVWVDEFGKGGCVAVRDFPDGAWQPGRGRTWLYGMSH